LYLYIKNNNDNCDIIDDITDYNFATNQISQYKIVISLENHYDSLVAAACGCYVISNNLKDDNLPSILYLDNLNSIISIIQNLLNLKDNDTIIATQNYISQNHSIDQFFTSINSIFLGLNRKAFLYAT
jgi:hypothetical protein